MIYFNTKQRLSVIPIIQIDGNHIEHVNEYKYLGVYIDVNLNWNSNVSYMANKISQRLGVLKKSTKASDW